MICKSLIHPATRLDAMYVAANLQEDDRQELAGLGHADHEMAVVLSVYHSEPAVTFWNPDGNICGVAGVSRTDAHCGAIWMLTTPHVRPYPKLFFKEAKKWVEQQTSFEMLYNIADPRNRMHLKLLHMLGFKRLSYVTTPTNLTYVEFAKLTKCASNLDQQQPLPSA
jgi:hypothetical protein